MKERFICLKKVSARAFSIMMVISLLIGLIPVSEIKAAAEDPVSELTGEKYLIDLNLCANKYYYSDLRKITIEDTTAVITPDMQGYIPWGFVGYDKSIIPVTAAIPEAYIRNGQAYGVQIQSGTKGQWVSIRFKMPVTAKSGKYYALYKYGTSYNGGNGDVYLAPWTENGDPALWRNASYKINETAINYYSKATVTGIMQTLNAVNVEAGADYVLTFKTNKANMYPAALTLIGIDHIKNVDFDLPADTLGFGDTETISVNGKMTDGTDIDFSKTTVTYSSSNTKIAEIDGTGKITSKRVAGSCDITFSVTKDDITKYMTKTITVIDKEPLTITAEKAVIPVGETSKIIPKIVLVNGSEADLTNASKAFYTSDKNVLEVDQEGNLIPKGEGVAIIREEMSYGEFNDIKIAQTTVTVTDSSTLDSVTLAGSGEVGVQRDEKLKLSGKMSSGYSAYLQGATISYEIVSCDPAGAVTISQDGTVTGVTLNGTATVKALVTLRGVTRESNLYSVTVVEPDVKDVICNFLENRPSNNKPLSATLDVQGWAINKAKSYDLVKNKAVSFNYYGNYPAYATYGIRATIETINTDSAYDFKVPYAGNYRFTFSGSKNSAGADAAIYVDDIYVGEYSFYSSDLAVTRSPTASLRSIPLTAGVHTVIIRSINRPGTGFYQYHNCMSFWGVDSLPAFDSIAVNLTKSTIVRGETATLNARIRLEDGFEFAANSMSTGAADPYASVTMESLDTNVFTIDSNGIITGVGAGTANVKLSAVYNGNTYTKEIPVTVTGNTLGTVEFETSRRVFYVGESFDLTAKAMLDNQTEITGSDTEISFVSSAPEVISISGSKLTATAVGTAQITATAVLGGKTVTNTINVEVKTDVFGQVTVDADNLYMKLTSEGIQLRVSGKTYEGQAVDLTGATIEYSSKNPDIATVDTQGKVMPKAIGTAEITATVKKDNVTVSGSANVTVRNGKISSTFYTPEKVAAARENITKYSWAKSLKDTTIKEADKYAGNEEMLWNMVTAEGIPRSENTGLEGDPNDRICRYCGADLRAEYGLNNEWYTDPINNPWKVKCRACGRSFPSNDFGSFYKLGLDEHGIFNVSLAHQRNDKLIENGEKGYLVNTLYPEKGEGWGVDDGFGYVTGRAYADGIKEVHTYIACYVHWGIWYNNGLSTGLIMRALESLSNAYMYTGDAKYGRTGAILLDRIADVFPGYDLLQYNNIYFDADGGSGNGKILGRQWDTIITKLFARSYDALFPAMDDPYVVSFLNDKAKEYKIDNDKSTSVKICQNIEDGILREMYKGCQNGKIASNFGMHQSALATAAVVLDTMPETKEWIDWLNKKQDIQNTSNTGGGIDQCLVNDVSRDGLGYEAAPGYNNIWLTNTLEVAEALYGYEAYPTADLYKNPKFVKMFGSIASLICAQKTAAAIGDSGSTAGYTNVLKLNDIQLGYQRIRDPEFAQLTYWLNGNTADGIHADIFTKNPEKLATDIQTVINKYGEYDWTKSETLPAYGFAILRSGNYYNSVGINETIDNQRDFWMYYGGCSTSHAHADSLNLGIEAYGINFAPDLGYPEATGQDANRAQWIDNTLSHNTVIVNEKRQSGPLVAGVPLHFDSTNQVKLIDVDMPDAYSETDIYRRTMVMVNFDSNISYGIDFFRILGGDDHLYSFHAASEDIYETDTDLKNKLVTQVGGSYAGTDVPFGNDPYTDESSKMVTLKYPQGYTWLQDVRKAEAPETGKFAVDFKIKDFRGMLPYPMNLHLRMTMLNDFNLDEVSLATGLPPRKSGNLDYINKLQYVLARRSGKNLDTLFTTVYEPYRDTRYVSSLDSVSVVKLEGDESSKDKVKAVKVTLVNGRVDYIIYATNNNVKYQVVDNDIEFDFRGFVGVYTMKDGKPVYSYLNDGDIIGESQNNTAAYTGKVLDFTKELAFDNSITVQFDSDVQLDKLAGRFINIANDGAENGVYQIQSAVLKEGNKVKLNLGNNTLIRSYIDANDIYAGYIYNIAAGQSFKIPLSNEEDNSPIFSGTNARSVDANSKISFAVSAVSPTGKTLTYSAVQLPRGASFNKDTKVFSWIPDSNQIGDNIVVIKASDGGMETTAYYKIKVLSSTSGGGTSGGTGGGTSGGTKTDDTKTDDTKTDDTKTDDTNVVIPTAEKFTDMAGYDWAKDAINELAEKGIINGTSLTTFSPGLNIKRADFAILLVRALELTSDSTENFTDVPEGSYYANELAIAKGSGIVTGVGENRFNPTEQISRQDMMVIVVRALEKAGYQLEAADDTTLSDYSDASEVSEYAKSAAAVLIKNGIITGNNGKINPKGNATRAEVAVIIKRILDINK